MSADDDLIVNARVRIPASELSFTAVRSGGPGGQNVNKVASKVELRFDVSRTRAIGPDARARLLLLAANKLDKNGAILLTSQLTRDQLQNREDARQKLAELVARALVVPRPRRKTKPSRASKEERLFSKRKNAERKRDRRRSDD